VIDTPLVERLRSSVEWQSSNPMRSPYAIDRKGKPEEIAQGALYLASDESSSWVTGTALVIDGGYTAL
jgi:NAD(P)-dependent dehydrogenase (short-subunit alcohol dehydrogenase family)